MQVVRLGLGFSAGLWLAGCIAPARDVAADEGDPDEMPLVGDCSQVDDWNSSWAAHEEEVLAIVNRRRAQGAVCGGAGQFGPAPALVMQANLRCAARLHSLDMAQRDFFSHETPEGDSPWDRMEDAGYVNWRVVGENIAAGFSDAESTVEQWMGSSGHCANIMNPDFTHMGVGYYEGGDFGHVWTQKLGRR